METGPLAVWLWNELTTRGLPIVCLDARHAKGSGFKKAKVAVARKLAVILHATWKTNEAFRYTAEA